MQDSHLGMAVSLLKNLSTRKKLRSEVKPLLKDSPLSSKVAMFNKTVSQHTESQLLIPFSQVDGRSTSPKPKFIKEEYGKPIAGSLTAARGQKANMHVFKEIDQLRYTIDDKIKNLIARMGMMYFTFCLFLLRKVFQFYSYSMKITPKKKRTKRLRKNRVTNSTAESLATLGRVYGNNVSKLNVSKTSQKAQSSEIREPWHTASKTQSREFGDYFSWQQGISYLETHRISNIKSNGIKRFTDE